MSENMRPMTDAEMRKEIGAAHCKLDQMGVRRTVPDSDHEGESTLNLLGRLYLLEAMLPPQALQKGT